MLPPGNAVDGELRPVARPGTVTERGEAIGVLELYLPREPDREDVVEIGRVAHLLAFVVIANRRHTDLFEWGQRDQTFSLSAEIQQRLLPQSRTCEAAAFTLAGWLEPAASIGGDTFDYSLARDELHLSLTDAMGHGVEAALTASMCLGALRGERRRGGSLLDQAAATNPRSARTRPAPTTTTSPRACSAASTCAPGPWTSSTRATPRRTCSAVPSSTALDLRVDLPLGMFGDTTYDITRLDLVAGDRLVLVTDGMLERNVASVDLPGAIRAPGSCTPGRSCAPSPTPRWQLPGRRSRTTPPCCAWTGTAATTRTGTPSRARSRAAPATRCGSREGPTRSGSARPLGETRRVRGRGLPQRVQLRLEERDEPLGVRHRRGVDLEADPDRVGVAEDADPQRLATPTRAPSRARR